MNETMRHYDLLIAEGNDPVCDPPELQEYMDGWDGAAFLEAMALSGTQSVLEIGMGTGRLAMRIAPRCRHYTGIDLSRPTVERAREHLRGFSNTTCLCGAFPEVDFQERFDVICSSLTFLHIADKASACRRIASLLAQGGRAVISLDRERCDMLDYGTRQLRTYPDTPESLGEHLRAAGLTVTDVIGRPFAWILIAERAGEEG